jgi:hypothetical protein
VSPFLKTRFVSRFSNCDSNAELFGPVRSLTLKYPILCARLIAAIERIFWLGPFVLRLRVALALPRRAADALPAAMLILLVDVLIANFDHLSR